MTAQRDQLQSQKEALREELLETRMERDGMSTSHHHPPFPFPPLGCRLHLLDSARTSSLALKLLLWYVPPWRCSGVHHLGDALVCTTLEIAGSQPEDRSST
jgi:hypothetical protein